MEELPLPESHLRGRKTLRPICEFEFMADMMVIGNLPLAQRLRETGGRDVAHQCTLIELYRLSTKNGCLRTLDNH